MRMMYGWRNSKFFVNADNTWEVLEDMTPFLYVEFRCYWFFVFMMYIVRIGIISKSSVKT
ncbi:unnamed protein product [Callosobruchus maculatus]|uniref:Uncharacterized protein n=1 Tax=Callosobruchus maculatus TaxID=64391 RepID=A0A653BJ78_CALMS|nr:unnamed protein product [Callosobruchus maculatus]